MITYVYGDMFYSPAKVLVNPVNTSGTMASGLSYDFKRFFPEMFEVYRAASQADQFNIGQVLLYKTPHKWLLNFPTKRHFRADSSLETIETGLKKLVRIYAELDMTSLSMPALGTEEEGLAWEDVRPILEAYLNPLPISVYIHLDEGKNAHALEQRNSRAMRRWLNELPEHLSFEQFWHALVKQIRSHKDYQTAKQGENFTVMATEAKGRQRLSLKISPRHSDSIFLPENQLRDLWQYLQRAGYALAENLPAGLETHADYLFALLAELPIFQSVDLALVNQPRSAGLHYLPPSESKTQVQEIRLGE